ncbi:MAG TPA: DUF1153 domain-containing protein [Stellaceae bacterium]|jgi:hypothetical protein
MATKPATSLPYELGTPASPFRSDYESDENELPSPSTKRWVIRRKAAVVNAVKEGILTLEQACERYKLSTEEFFTWQTLVEQHGIPGLRVTRLQTYRAGDRR